MHPTLSEIEECLRIPAPCPAPIGLACDGTDLWIGSSETNRIYGLKAHQGTVFEEALAPGRPFGITVTGDALRVVVSEGPGDDRFIRRYIMGKHFKSERIPAPDLTGSFLAYDGDRLYLSQRDNKVILELDESGRVLRTIPVPRQITGMVVVAGRFYLVTTESREVDDYRLLCWRRSPLTHAAWASTGRSSGRTAVPRIRSSRSRARGDRGTAVRPLRNQRA